MNMTLLHVAWERQGASSDTFFVAEEEYLASIFRSEFSSLLVVHVQLRGMIRRYYGNSVV